VLYSVMRFGFIFNMPGLLFWASTVLIVWRFDTYIYQSPVLEAEDKYILLPFEKWPPILENRYWPESSDDSEVSSLSADDDSDRLDSRIKSVLELLSFTISAISSFLNAPNFFCFHYFALVESSITHRGSRVC
jgi:hypothetical protein